MTLTEYSLLLKCDDNATEIDSSKMNKDHIEKIEARHEENKLRREEKNIVVSPKEFVTDGE
jgi:hypothetical protein